MNGTALCAPIRYHSLASLVLSDMLDLSYDKLNQQNQGMARSVKAYPGVGAGISSKHARYFLARGGGGGIGGWQC